MSFTFIHQKDVRQFRLDAVIVNVQVSLLEIDACVTALNRGQKTIACTADSPKKQSLIYFA